jgi:PQQ-like domain/WD40-like Beta Propeller Repeat
LKTLRTTGPEGTSPRTPRWSPDGQRLYSSHPDGLAVWDLTRSAAPRVFASGLKSTDGPEIAVSPDGKFVVASMPRPMTVCWDADTGQERWREKYYGPIGVSSDSRFVVRSYFAQRFDFVDAATGKATHAFGAPAKAYLQAASDDFTVSPDGHHMAVSMEGYLGVRNTHTGRELWWKRVGNQSAIPLVFSPDGLWLATAMDSNVMIYDAITGEWLWQLVRHGQNLTSLDFTPDGRRVLTAYTDGTALLRELAPPNQSPADLWSALRSDDGNKAYAAVWGLARERNGPELLRGYLPAVPRLNAAGLDRLVADLDANRHAVRERASRALNDQGRAALPALQAARGHTKSAESAARLEKLIQAVEPGFTSQEVIHRRAIKAMSLAGTAEAGKLLAEWASGAPGAVLTEEAKAALARR